MRIIKNIEIEGNRVNALFDTGSFHTWIVKSLLQNVPSRPLRKSYKVALGGRIFEVKEHYLITGKIEGYEFDTKANSIDELRNIDGKVIDAIIGAETMEEWEIIPNPKDGTLDLSGLKRREFIEY